MTDKRILWVKGGITFFLLGVSALMLFVPVVDSATEVRAMWLMLTGIAVRDFYGATQEDKRVKELKQALDPSPPQSYIHGDDEE